MPSSLAPSPPTAPRRRRRAWLWATLQLALMLFLAACERSPKPQTSVPPPVGAVTYEVTGTLHRLDPAKGVAVIAHADIPDYMDAMTMPFTAAEPGELANLQPGDLLAFRLTVTDTRSSISHIRKTGHTALPPAASAEISASTPALPVIGTPLPDATLLDDQGRSLRLADFHGRVLAVTFIFTRCPLPDFCPLLSRNFSEAERALAAAQAGEKCHLFSVTIDPAYDTPERLAAYAKGLRADPARWSFATGEPHEIARLGAAVGLETRGEGLALTHNLRTVVVDRNGKIQKIFTGNEWKPSDLVDEMKRALEKPD